jgi:Mrp family chromosome partitioning ATPase
MTDLPVNYIELESIYARTIGSGFKSIAVTSALAGEGVTTLVEALAKRVIASGRKVLVVDLNILHPEFTQRLDISVKDWQLSKNDLPLSIVNTGDCSLLPAPIGTKSLLQLREQSLLKESLDLWLTKFDVVIIDTSPVNAVNRGNIPAEHVCAACEGVVFMVMAGATSESAIVEALKRLRCTDTRILGSVINDRLNPSLANELIRETYRLERWLPKMMDSLRNWIRHSNLLNVQI